LSKAKEKKTKTKIMKLNLLTLGLLFNCGLLFSQTNTNISIKNELITCKNENEKIKQENDYLKKSLNIQQPIKNLIQNEVELKIVKIEGNIKEQTITFTLFITNHKANDDFQFNTNAQAIDFQGKEYTSDKIYIGNSYVRNKLYTDTPLEVKVKFMQVLPSTRILKIFNLESYQTGIFDSGNFEFRDLEINWK
jgi:hypothetical protein